jgi:hypothetical protein
MCRNWKFWVALVAIAAGIVAFTPVGLTAVLPLLVVAACPLMMVLGGGILYRGAQSANRSHAVTQTQVAEHRSDRERVST